MKVWTVRFYNLGYSKHYATFNEACDAARSSGFECNVIDPDGTIAAEFMAY